MHYFIDTNIAISYSLIHDKHHKKSIKFINNKYNDIYWSNIVENEYTNKINKINNDTIDFLQKVEKIIKNENIMFFNNIDFENRIIQKTKNCKLDQIKKRKLLFYIWDFNQNNFAYSNKLLKHFNDFISSYNLNYINMDNNLRNKTKLHNCGFDNYKKYINYLKLFSDNGVHVPDCKIIGDAHDLALNVKPLTFISCDENMLNNLNNLDLTFIEIYEFKSICN